MANDWIPIEARLPKTGEVVYVRTKFEHQPHLATFYAKPHPRWELGSTVHQLEFFAFWKPAKPVGS